MAVKINSDETVEVPLDEYEAIKAVAAGIAEQNQIVLDSLKALGAAMVKQAETVTSSLVELSTAITGLNITVNVPEQPAPIVNVTVPQQPAPNVTVQEAAEGPKKISLTLKRDRNGVVTGFEGTEK